MIWNIRLVPVENRKVEYTYGWYLASAGIYAR
jgi:hypothetical protein